MSYMNHVSTFAVKLNLVCKGQNASLLPIDLVERLRQALVNNRFVGEWAFFTGDRVSQATGVPGISIIKMVGTGIKISFTKVLPDNRREVVEGILRGPEAVNILQVYNRLEYEIHGGFEELSGRTRAETGGVVLIDPPHVLVRDADVDTASESESVVNDTREKNGAPALTSDQKLLVMVDAIKHDSNPDGSISQMSACRAIGRSQGRDSGRGAVASIRILVRRGLLVPIENRFGYYRLSEQSPVQVLEAFSIKKIQEKAGRESQQRVRRRRKK